MLLEIKDSTSWEGCFVKDPSYWKEKKIMAGYDNATFRSQLLPVMNE